MNLKRISYPLFFKRQITRSDSFDLKENILLYSSVTSTGTFKYFHSAIREQKCEIKRSPLNRCYLVIKQQPVVFFPTRLYSSHKTNKPHNNKPSLALKYLGLSLATYIVIKMFSLVFDPNVADEQNHFLSWNEFYYQMLSRGEVEKIIIRPGYETITIILKENLEHRQNSVYFMNIVDPDKFENKLKNAEKTLGIEAVPITYDRYNALVNLFYILIFIIIIRTIYMKKKISPYIMDSFSQMGKAKFTLFDPMTSPSGNINFQNVAGLKEAKIEVMEFVDYLKRPERYKNLGAKVPKGALLLGPPGCGKTLLARALATEACVPFLSMSGSEFIDAFGGMGAARVRDLFKEANKRSPSIIYIDEIDGIGKERSYISSYSNSQDQEQTLNQLLVEMNGMSSKDGVMVLASTNRAEVLDKALLRPGRFDRHVYIDLPTVGDRKEIFEQHLKKIVLDNKASFYSSRLAQITSGSSGADIASMCNESALHAARLKKKFVTEEDLFYGIERLSSGIEKTNHSISPNERRIIAYHESGHALVGWLLERNEVLQKVSIIPRTSTILSSTWFSKNDKMLYTKEELLDSMCIALGGRAAEALFFNKVSTQSQIDLKKVTSLAYAQVCDYGMSDVVGPISLPEYTKQFGKTPYSKSLNFLVDSEVQKLIAKSYYFTADLIKNNNKKLSILAETLLMKETLQYDDLKKLIGNPRSEKYKFNNYIKQEKL